MSVILIIIECNMTELEKSINVKMQSAIQQAHNAQEADEVPIGAVIYKDGTIIGRGFNQTEQLQDPTAHAEIIAITSAANTLNDWRLSGCELFVTKEPCPMCAGAIINARIKFLGFGAYDEHTGCCGSLYQICQDPRFTHQTIVRGGVLEMDCEYLLKQFFLNKRK